MKKNVNLNSYQLSMKKKITEKTNSFIVIIAISKILLV